VNVIYAPAVAVGALNAEHVEPAFGTSKIFTIFRRDVSVRCLSKIAHVLAYTISWTRRGLTLRS